MLIQEFIKIFHIVEDLDYFHILALACHRTVKFGILQARWLDLVGINLCVKND